MCVWCVCVRARVRACMISFTSTLDLFYLKYLLILVTHALLKLRETAFRVKPFTWTQDKVIFIRRPDKDLKSFINLKTTYRYHRSLFFILYFTIRLLSNSLLLKCHSRCYSKLSIQLLIKILEKKGRKRKEENEKKITCKKGDVIGKQQENKMFYTVLTFCIL